MREAAAELRPGVAALWLAAILAVGLFLRVASPHVDPDRAFGTDYLTDEGFYTKNARLLVETGRWLRPQDNHNHLFLAPLHCAVNALAFAIFGPSLTTARAVVAMAGMALILVVFAALRRAAGARAALLGAAFVAVDPALVHLSRVALVEGTLALATAVVFATFARGPFDRGRFLGVAAAWSLAFLLKGSALAILPGLACAWLLLGLSERRLGAALGQLGGCLAVCAAVMVAFRAVALRLAGTIFDHATALHFGVLSPERIASALLDAVATKTALVGLQRSPVVAAIAVVTALPLLAAARRTDAHTRALLAAAIGWLVGQILFFSALPYQPWRYFLSLGAPAAIVAALALHHGASLASALGVRMRDPRASRIRLFQRAVAGIAVAVATAYTLLPFALDHTTDLEARATAQRHFQPGDIVVGFFADSFTLGTGAHGVVVHGPWNSTIDPATAFGATRLLLGEAEGHWVFARFPDLAARAVHLAPVPTARGDLDLYAIRPLP